MTREQAVEKLRKVSMDHGERETFVLWLEALGLIQLNDEMDKSRERTR